MEARIKVIRNFCEISDTEVKEVGVATAEVPIRDVNVSLFEAIGNKIVELSEEVYALYPSGIEIIFDVSPSYKDDIYDVINSIDDDIYVCIDSCDEPIWEAKITPSIIINGTYKDYSANTIKNALIKAAREVLG